MKQYYNINTIVLVTVKDVALSHRLWYVPEKQLRKNRIKPAYITSIYGYANWTMEEFLNTFRDSNFIKDNRVYTYPEVLLSFVDGSEKSFFFNTYEEALQFNEYLLGNMNVVDNDGIIIKGEK